MSATKGASTRRCRRGTCLAEGRSVRIPWPALLESAASSTSAPQLPLRTASRKTSFGRELAAALKQGTPVESVQDDRGAKFEGAAIAIAMPLPDQVAALPGTKHDLHPPHVIERDVFVRVVAGRLGTKAPLPQSTPTPSGVAASLQSEAKAPAEFGAVTRESASRVVAEDAQPNRERSSHARELPVPTMASRVNSSVSAVMANEAQVLKPHDRLPRDSNDDKQRDPGLSSRRDVPAAVVHADTEAGINIERPQPETESASTTAVPKAASIVAARQPEAAQSVAAPVLLEVSPATSQAAIDPAVPRSIPDELPDSETRHPPNADSVATRDLIHTVGATRQDKPTTVVHSLEPAERWPAPRVSVVDVPGAATERAVNQALDAVREITIDGLAQRKVMQPQRWSMLPEATQAQVDNTHVDSGAEHESASDSAPHGQDHADPPTTRDTSTPSVRVGTHGALNAALQQPAAENVSSASVSHAAVAASASPPATAPIAAAPVRLEASPATVPALIDQVVHRLLDAPANGTVTLRLDPPELGTLLVRFQRRGSQLSVTMTAEREDVSRLLRQGLGQLQSSLSQLHEQVSVQVDTHGESRGRGDESALGSRRQRESESRQNEPDHDQDATSSRETPAQRARRTLRDARLDVWS